MLKALQQYYASHCDGEWEHQYGFALETCDNPGWLLKIRDPALFNKISKQGVPPGREESVSILIADQDRSECWLFAGELAELEHYVAGMLHGIP